MEDAEIHRAFGRILGLDDVEGRELEAGLANQRVRRRDERRRLRSGRERDRRLLPVLAFTDSKSATSVFPVSRRRSVSSVSWRRDSGSKACPGAT